MAQSKCGHCGSTRFEISETEPRGSNYKLFFIQCASCGAPVSSLEYMSNNHLLDKLTRAIKKIADTLDVHVDL